MNSTPEMLEFCHGNSSQDTSVTSLAFGNYSASTHHLVSNSNDLAIVGDEKNQPKKTIPNPKKWTEVYPYGTKEGDEESRFFKALARSKYDWRSTGAIVKESKLTRDRVEEIIDKYVNKVKPPLVYPHKSNEDTWGYWERCPEVLQKDIRKISEKDKDNRIDKQSQQS